MILRCSLPLFVVFSLQAQGPPGFVPDFVKDIQPVLEKSCLNCHGEKLQSAGLRLDKKPAADKLALIYKRVAGEGNLARMPMGGALPPDQIAKIKAWTDAGSNWPEGMIASAPKTKHWAFIPPVRPALPVVNDAKWGRNEIDRFVLAKLESEGLKPSPEADRPTLLRRVSLDLIGLPPSPEEIDAFLKDKSPRAWEKQVDRLLASPHYGEKWARHWLDGARYADSDGYEKDKPRFVWFYRDWVINAFNRNLPYNEFIIDQLAGDLRPDATQDQRVATGYLRNSMINEEGGVDPEQFRMEAMYDRMDAIGKGMLGVTIQCAQCHNHKYDPLQQEEYYRLFAFLNNSNEATAAVYTPEQQMKIADITRRTSEIGSSLQHRTADWEARMQKWEAAVVNDQPAWTVVKPEVDDISTGGQKYVMQEDGSLVAQGYAPTKHTVKLTVKTKMKNIRAFRLELMTDPNLPLGGPGRSIKGTGVLSEFKVEAQGPRQQKPEPVKLVSATADLNLPEAPLEAIYFDKSTKKRLTGPIAFAIDGNDDTAWGIDAGPGLRNQARKAVFNTESPVGGDGETTLIFYLKQNGGGWNSDDNQNNNLGRIRISLTDAEGVVADPVPARVRQILATPRAQRSPAQVQEMFGYWRTTMPEWKDENDTIAALWHTHPEGASQLVLNERISRRETHQLIRGDFLQPGKVVSGGVPSFLNPLPAGEPVNRLTFAKWMVARDAPTTARAFVNRIWQAYYGIGIVETSEDFGTQSSPPSHPQLLDWLAVEFMDRKWDIKAVQRLIATSSTYRQSSNVTPELLSKDPYNRLLARGPRFRVDGEIVRDIALSASGLLSDKVGGPSVFPPAPAFLFLPPTSYGPKVWNESANADKYRRAIYTFRFRSVPYPMLQTFDSPTGDSSCVRRSRSNTPLQALTTLNEPLFIESARALAAKVLKEGGATDSARLTFAMRRVTGRVPSGEEAAELLKLLAKEQGRFADGRHDAKQFAGVDSAQAAAWTAVSRVLLNLDETITKE
jgi:hypothetical protein